MAPLDDLMNRAREDPMRIVLPWRLDELYLLAAGGVVDGELTLPVLPGKEEARKAGGGPDIPILPRAGKMVKMALETARNVNGMSGRKRRATMPPFSAKCSAPYPWVDRTTKAAKIVRGETRQVRPEEGPWADAVAIVQIDSGRIKIGRRGNAPIFPDLDPGNTSCKRGQRLEADDPLRKRGRRGRGLIGDVENIIGSMALAGVGAQEGT